MVPNIRIETHNLNLRRRVELVFGRVAQQAPLNLCLLAHGANTWSVHTHERVTVQFMFGLLVAVKDAIIVAFEIGRIHGDQCVIVPAA